MPKTVDISVINNIGHPKEMIENLLDKLVESIESSLGKKAKGSGRNFLALFVNNKFRVQLSEEEIFDNLQTQTGLNKIQIEGILSSFVSSGIIRKTSLGQYELANNYIASRAQDKIDAENRVLRTIKTTVQERIKHQQYLDKQYLNHIAPSISLIDFSKSELRFIEKSKRLIQRKSRLIRLLFTILLLGILLLTTFIYINYKKVQNFNEILRQEKINTTLAKEDAEDQRQQAETAQEMAEIARDRALANERIANRQIAISDSLIRIAIADKDSISKLNLKTQNSNLEQIRLRREADENALKYQKLAEERKRQEKIAREQEAKTDLLNKIITSRIAADRSLIIADEMERALVALEAYQINQENPSLGDIYHPSIIAALTGAAPKVDKKLTYKKHQHNGSIRDIVMGPYENIFYTTGSDGTIQQWQVEKWNPIGTPNLRSIQTFDVPTKAVINSMDLSPRGGQMLAAGEWSYFQAFSTQSGKVLSHYPYQGGMDEIFHCGYDSEGNLIGLGKDNYYYWNGGQLITNKKLSGKGGIILNENGTTNAYSINGHYDDYSYKLYIQKLSPFLIGPPEEYTFYGKSKEVNYGAVSAVAVKDFGPTKRLTALGFSKGKIMILNSDKSFDPFLGDHQVFNYHQAAITDISFSENGKFLAVASMDKSISVWDLSRIDEATYQPMVFGNMSSWCLSVAFGEKDEFVLAGTQNGDLYFWNIQPEAYAAYICSFLHNNPEMFLEEENQANIKQRKSIKSKGKIDEISVELLLKYFGIEDSPKRIRRVCQ